MPRLKSTNGIVLKKPEFIAAWPGVHNVALSAIDYIRKKMQAKPLLRMEHGEFFSPSGVAIEKGLVTRPSFPANDFYYWQDPNNERDVLFFLSDGQPDFHTYEFANKIMDIAQSYGARSVCTAAAYINNDMHFTEKPRIWGAATRTGSAQLLAKYGIPLMQKGIIAGMNGLLLGVARERRMPAMCLLSEVPKFTVPFNNPRAACLILENMKQLLELQVDLDDLEKLASKVEAELEKASKEAMGKYIQEYTVDYRDFFSEEQN
ncbi:MAG: PAC2 family protein [Chloroflexi bacterium]|nr:PAC2 family protein [Chloroflexota bacterium]